MDATDAVLIIGTKTIVTLLPLVPAYVLFATLKSRADVTGPFSGLKIQLGGAFAAYFIVLLVLSHGVGEAMEQFHYHSWNVKGKVKFETTGRAPDYAQITTYMRPPDLPVRKDGTFEFEVPVRELSNGELVWPQLSMEVEGFEPGFIHLYEPSRQPKYGAELIPESYDRVHRVIELQEAVLMRSKADAKPYDSSHAQTAAPVVAAAISQ